MNEISKKQQKVIIDVFYFFFGNENNWICQLVERFFKFSILFCLFLWNLKVLFICKHEHIFKEKVASNLNRNKNQLLSLIFNFIKCCKVLNTKYTANYHNSEYFRDFIMIVVWQSESTNEWKHRKNYVFIRFLSHPNLKLHFT